MESLIKAGAFDSLGYRRRAMLVAAGTIVEDAAEDSRKNIAGQMDLFGLGDEETDTAVHTMALPDIPEFSRQERMAMEKETTGLYLTGHPMDDYRDLARGAGAVAIAAVLSDFAEGEPTRFRDNQEIKLAGVVAAAKTRPTKNNSLMSYITLEDDTGSMELIAFQRALDQGGSYIRENAALLVRGRISLRDEKEPQLMVDNIRPLTDLNTPGRTAAASKEPPAPETPAVPGSDRPRTLFVRLPSREDTLFRRVTLLQSMFPGSERMVLYFEDTKKRAAAPCLIHPAFVEELRERCGEANVVVK